MSESVPKAIQISNLSKFFNPLNNLPEALAVLFRRQKRITVLDKINLEIKKGEIFCLLGANGAGKTTLLKILATLILPSGGKALVNGFDILSESIKVRKSIGLLLENERSFYWRLTGRQNLNFFAALYGLTPREIKIKVDYFAQVLRINQLMDKKYAEYSKGIKQKFALARSLVHNPDILFLDEPTKSLDLSARKEFWYFVKNELLEKNKKTIIFSTHNTEEALHADSVGIMREAKLEIIKNDKNTLGISSLTTFLDNLSL